MKNFLKNIKSISDLHSILSLVLIAIIAVITFLTIKSCSDSFDKNVESLSGVAENFKKGNITTTFISSMPEIFSTNGNILEVSVLKTTEFFNQKDNIKIFWGALDLGKNIVEIRVPVTYRYHIRLNEDWRLTVNKNECIVYAPEIRASQPPAIHTDEMQKFVIQEGWARYDAKQSLEELQSNLTPKLIKRAESNSQIELVKEKSRKSVENFVKNWLLKENQWGKNKFNSIKVIFPSDKYSPSYKN